MKLNSFQLKCIAMVTMLIDHVGAILFPQYVEFRYIGRMAFPIFCFLLTEGFFYTRDVKKYLIRLGCFALISEIPYDLAFRENVLDLEKQNVFFTLFLGVILMQILRATNSATVKVAYVFLVMWLAEMIRCDYGFKGILLITIYHVLRENKIAKGVAGAMWNCIGNSMVQVYGALATLPILAYNGEKGKSMKYVFYMFYPIHLLILYGIIVLT